MRFTLQDQKSRDKIFTAVEKTSEVFSDSDLTVSEVFSVLTILFSTVVRTSQMNIDDTVGTLGRMLHAMEEVDESKIKESLQ
mgnify:CR=1 FL=1